MKLDYNLTGAERKKLALAISHELNAPLNYLGAPTFAWEIGGYHIDKVGTVTGPDNRDLMNALAEQHGFVSLVGEFDDDNISAFEDIPLTEREELGLGRERRDPVGEDGPQASDVPEPDTLAIELPLDGFTPEVIDRLCKMVTAKEPLLKKALGAEALPIEVLEDSIRFPWFTLGTPEQTEAYTQFIAALCKTAKEKKRITAKAKDSVENEKFTMRVFLVGLGLIGKEYSLTRKLLMTGLSGNSSWRNGAPPVATVPADSGAELAEALADEELIQAVNASFEADTEEVTNDAVSE
jgi:hypothetical protein